MDSTDALAVGSGGLKMVQDRDILILHATLQGVRITSAMLKIVFRHILFFCFLNAVWALTSGGFRIVSDTLV